MKIRITIINQIWVKLKTELLFVANRTAGPGLGVSLLSDSTVFSSALVTGQRNVERSGDRETSTNCSVVHLETHGVYTEKQNYVHTVHV